MRVLVTGGAGYIGSMLTRMLVDSGYKVRVLDRFFFGNDSLRDVLDRIEVVRDDVRWVAPSVLKDVDAVIDMAALSNDPAGELDPLKTVDINYLGRVRMAKLSKEVGVGRYLLASSCSVYGFQEGVLNEASRTDPLTTYARCNVLWEKDALPLCDEKFTVVALRQATVYGFSYKMRFDLAINGMALGLVKDKKIPILRDGNQFRPFVHVKDTSRAFIAALEADADKVNGQIFNIGSNEQNYRIFDLAKMVAESIGVPFDYEWYGNPDKRSYQVSFDKVKSVLGFGAKYTAADGAREICDALKDGRLDPNDLRGRTVEWYKHIIKMQEFIDGGRTSTAL
jgi:nucleoside-diphosphate-sugar epimerase